MPIHAAGIYKGDAPICVSDYFVSSYTPTLDALIDARTRPHPTELKVLAAAQPNPGRGYCRLPSVTSELQEIVNAVPPQYLPGVGKNNQPDFDGQHTSVKSVLEHLERMSVLHLACHGTQISNDPLGSGFVLADGQKLTILDFIKSKIPNAHTAILSACHTASNDVIQPDECMGLANALLFLGFRSILATKWCGFPPSCSDSSVLELIRVYPFFRPMFDSDGPLIARAVYRSFFELDPDDIHSVPEYVWRCLDRHREDDELSQANGAPEGTDPKSNPQPGESKPPIDFASIYSKAINERSGQSLDFLDLPGIVDNLARELRLKGAPARQWATFVHIGV